MKITGINSYTSWMVAIACGAINCLNLSAYRLSGLIYVAILEHYDTDRQTASIPIILFIVIRSLGGPFIGILGQKFGIEEITLIGCFLSAVGFGGSFFAEDMVVVTIFLGVVYGIGITFGNTLLPNILKKHFTKNFNSANGIYTAGSCVGAFVFPPIAVYLLNTYGVSGTFLIVSGFMLNGVPVSMLVRVARSTLIKAPQKSRISKTEGTVEEKIKLPLLSPIQNLDSHSSNQVNNKDKEKNEISRLSDISPESNEKLEMYSEINMQDSISKQLAEDSANIIEDDKNFKQISNNSYLISNDQNEDLCKEENIILISKNVVSDSQCTDLKHEYQLNGSQMKNNASQNEADVSVSCPEILRPSSETTNTKVKNNIVCHSLKIFQEPTFLIIIVIQSLHAFVMSLVWTTLIDYSRDKGIARSKEVYILMFHPLADIFGRLAFGWVTDKGFLSLSKYTVLGFILMGLATVLIAISKNFAIMMTGALFFAVTSGALFSITPAMIFDFMDKDQHIMGLASRSIFYVPLSFTAAPLIGYFRGNVGSYDGLYYIFAALCLICSFMTPLMPIFSRIMKNKRRKPANIHV